MEIITGRTGTPHVYAADDAEIYKLFLGNGDFVLPTGNKLNAQMNGTTQVRIYDGSLITQGRLAKIRPTDGYDTVTLDIGAAGYKRVDLIVAEYNQTVTTTQEEIDGEVVNVTNTFESITLNVVKGTPNANQYVEPAITTGDIDTGATHQVKLWAVYLDGINFDRLVDYRVQLTTSPLQPLLDAANAYFAQLETQVQSIAADLREGMVGAVTGYFRVNSESSPASFVEDSSISLGVAISEPSGYTRNQTDIYELYLNGLRLNLNEFGFLGELNGALHFVLLDYQIAGSITALLENNTLELVILKVGE